MKSSLSRNAWMAALVVAAGLGLLAGAGCQQGISGASGGGTFAPSATPRLVEIGTAICIPCAMMKPDLDALKSEYAGRLQIEVIDILVTPGAKTEYSAPDCATQIYIAASGRELYRHVGYSSKSDILANWKTLGVDLDAPAGR
jgi:thioredoxin 1